MQIDVSWLTLKEYLRFKNKMRNRKRNGYSYLL